jgi:curved DNA-binding protein CbpA
MIIKQMKHENKVGQSGKPFESCQILTTNSQGQDVWISGFGNEITHTWKAGHEVDVKITSKEGNNGKTYWNFELNENSKSMPSEELELLQKINGKLDLLLGSKVSNYEVSTDDIPF